MAMSKTRDFLLWTDDKMDLFLRVTQEYKVTMAAKNVNWESSSIQNSSLSVARRNQGHKQRLATQKDEIWKNT